MPPELLQPGHNCWRLVKSDQLAFLIDGEDSFRAFRAAVLQARRFVGILSWDIHSRVRTERDSDPPTDGFPTELGPFFEAVLEARPELHIHILNWDYSMIYIAEREWRLFSDSFGRPHPRLHFHADDALPASASHHQKVWVIDDEVAFVGGMDLSIWRWDTSAHHFDDDRRTDPHGNRYQPYHDVQAVVSGEAARALGDLFRERWRCATGEPLEPHADRATLPWPQHVGIDFKDVHIGIARTRALYEGQPEVRELLQLHLDAIAAARQSIFLINQYLSSRELVDALIQRLQEPEGPEVILVITRMTEGWLEQKTMGVLRDRLLERIDESDTHKRFQVYYPEAVEGDQKRQIYVHAKVFIVDDRIVHVGSANLSNRSMKVDSECGIVMERPGADPGIARFRNRLLGTFFNLDADAVASHHAHHENLRGLIQELTQREGNTLRPLPFGCSSEAERALADSQILDPDEPIDAGFWLQRTVPRSRRKTVLRRLAAGAVALVLVIGLALALQRGWGAVLDRDAIENLVEQIRDHQWTPVLLVLLFFLAGVSGFSINVILVATVLVVGPWHALGAGISGALLSALAGFGAGRSAGKPLVSRISSRDIESMSRWIGRLGIPGVALARLIPVAPFVVVNLLAGASHLKLSTFLWGTLWGVIPGMLAVVLLTDRVRAAVRDPGWATFGTVAALVAVALVLFIFVRRKLSSGTRTSERPSRDG